ncbi:DUF1127 domain-containing protein [Roseobacter sp. HKCCA0434]|uniref:DUF1127 domain-containing protein n=1 Tax=Roseobacter sp. HKCCA0434 TaxID=3079297 RepID=UPI002905BA56|nr:DUF1127 domain-containing protein [Roseobacter sp. HKCCA0434]
MYMTATLPRAARRGPSLMARLMGWSACARSRRRLAELDADRLADLGLTRAEVARECAKPFWA